MNLFVNLTSQGNAEQRLMALRWTCVAALIRDSLYLPPLKYFDAPEVECTRLRSSRPALSPSEVTALAIIAPTAGMLWALDAAPRVTGLVATAASWRLDALKKRHLPGKSSATGHLQQVMLLAALASAKGGRQRHQRHARDSVELTPSEVLAILQSCVALVYTQSAITKIRESGLEWAFSGHAIRNNMALIGTPLGRRMSAMPGLCRVAAVSTLALECVAIPAVLAGPRSRKAFGIAITAFHVASFATLRISFWHLSWLNGPLFLLKE